MDIKCSKCGTEYSLDDTLISGSGTSVRCMNCNQVFKVYKTGARGQDEWVLRQAHGPFRTLDNLGVLQQWIQAGKISPNDLLSKKNGQWKKIGDIEQLKPFFKKARPSSAASGTAKDVSKDAALKARETDHRNADRVRDTDNTEKFVALKQTPVVIGRTVPQKNAEASKKTEQTGADAAPTVENDKPTLPPPMTAELSLSGESSESEITRIFNKPEQLATSFAPEKKSAPSAASEPQPAAPSFAPEEKSDSAVFKTSSRSDAPDFSSIPAVKEDVAWEGGEKATTFEPAWTEKSGSLPRYESKMDDLPPPRRSTGKWFVLGAVVVGLGVAALFLFWPEKKDELLSTVGEMVSSPEAARYQKFFDRGRENFLLDTNTSFLQADREFQKVLALKEGDSHALAALARLYSVWAQYQRDAKLDSQEDVLSLKSKGEEKNRETEILSRSFDEKLQEASRWSRQASAAEPSLKEALLAAADTARLSGNLEEASSLLKKAEAAGTDSQTAYVSVLIELDKNALNKDAASKKALLKRAAERLEDAVGNQPMIRAIYRIARLRAAAGQKDEAKKQLAKLFELNADHPQAKDLSARIDAGKPVPIFDEAAAAARVAEAADTETVTVAASPEAPEGTSAERPSEKKKEGGGESASQRIYSRLKRAAALQKNGHFDAAKLLYQEVLDREPSNVEALTGMGNCSFSQGNNGKALASFRRALDVVSSYGPALFGIAQTYKAMGQKEQSLKFYRRFLAVRPSGRQAETARENISRFEAELKRESSDSAPLRRERGAGADEDDYVIDDSPKAAPTAEKPPTQSSPSVSEEKNEAPAASGKPTIIILKKDEPSASEE